MLLESRSLGDSRLPEKFEDCGHQGNGEIVVLWDGR